MAGRFIWAWQRAVRVCGAMNLRRGIPSVVLVWADARYARQAAWRLVVHSRFLSGNYPGNFNLLGFNPPHFRAVHHIFLKSKIAYEAMRGLYKSQVMVKMLERGI
jgi:hypothetical protein